MVTARSQSRTNAPEVLPLPKRRLFFCGVQLFTPSVKARSYPCPGETRLNQAKAPERGRVAARRGGAATFPQQTAASARFIPRLQPRSTTRLPRLGRPSSRRAPLP